MPKYSKKAGKKVERAMHEKKAGTLKSGRSGKKVTSRKQAIAIGLSEAREEGAKVPKKAAKKSAKKTASKKSAAKKTSSQEKKPQQKNQLRKKRRRKDRDFFHAKAPRSKGAKIVEQVLNLLCSFAPLRLCVKFLMMPFLLS
jgi:hypothetical protein